MGFEGLAPSAPLLLFGLVLDTIFGDPQLRAHPIRLLGNTLTGFESLLRRLGLRGYTGGCALFVLLAVCWIILPGIAIHEVSVRSTKTAWLLHVLTVYMMFAMRDLVDHVRAVRDAAGREDLHATHNAIRMLVGRDTERMDLAACRRAAIESLSENLVDGFVSPLFWYTIAGLPGLLMFKVVSTMDSMVGYKTDRYLRFGWFGARLDDAMNFLPARLTWLLLGCCAFPFGLSGRKGWRTGLRQHSIVPGPNPGWSEATMAGVLKRRLIGPIWKEGALVTDVWLGDPSDPPAGTDRDVGNAIKVSVLTSAVAAVVAAVVLQA